MDPQNYDVVFNLAQEPYRGWFGVAAFPFILVAVGLGMLVLGERAGVKVLGVVIAVFALTAGVVAQFASWEAYQRLQRSFSEGHFSDVEGYVDDFRPDPADPTDADIFHVGSRRFEVVRPEAGSAYSGRVNLNHRCVRIFYTDRNEIIWLGIRRSGCEPMETLQPENNSTDARLWDP